MSKTTFRVLAAAVLCAFALVALGVNTYIQPRPASFGSTVSVTGAFSTTDVDCGASGTAGSLDVFPTTAAKGKVEIIAADSAGNTTTTITNASQSGARIYTIQDAGASANFVMSEGAAAINGAKTFGSAITPTGGIVAAASLTASPRLCATGGNPVSAATDGTDYTVVATEVLIAEVFVPCNMSITGVALFNGLAVAGNVKVGLARSSGGVVATSASTAQAGTDAYQLIPFTAPYAALGPATYYVLAIGDTGGGTSKINTHTFGTFGAAIQVGQDYATGFTTITPPTTFTTATGAIANLY